MNEPTHVIFPIRVVGGMTIAFDDYGDVKIMGLLRGCTYVIPRADALLLARRINQALEYRRRWKRKKVKDV